MKKQTPKTKKADRDEAPPVKAPPVEAAYAEGEVVEATVNLALEMPPDLGDRIEEMAAAFTTWEDMAILTGFSAQRLYAHFGERANRARCVAALNLRVAQLQSAREGHVPMLIWVGKQFLGQCDGRTDKRRPGRKSLEIEPAVRTEISYAEARLMEPGELVRLHRAALGEAAQYEREP